MVPSGPMTGAVLTGGRCEPQVTLRGTAVGLGGQGRSAVEKRHGHWSVAAGEPGTSVAHGTAVAWSEVSICTSWPFTQLNFSSHQVCTCQSLKFEYWPVLHSMKTSFPSMSGVW